MRTILILAAILGVAAGIETREARETRAREQARSIVSQTVGALQTLASAHTGAGNDLEAARFDSLAVYGAGLLRRAGAERGVSAVELRDFRGKLDRWLVIADSLRAQGSADIEPCRDAVATLPPLD